MEWHAEWIWHGPEPKMDNFYMLARRAVTFEKVPRGAYAFVTASSLYKLYVNGRYVGRGPNPSDPSRYYYDVHDVTQFLREGETVVAAVCYNYGEKAHGILGQNWGRGGFLMEIRAPGREGEPVLATDASWRVRRAPGWDPDAPVNCTLLGDFKETYDSRREREADGWMAPGYDASAEGGWLEPEVLGRPPVAPWTRLVEREIPFLGGEEVYPVNVTWESASVTYSWRDDWEVYDEQTLVPGGPHARRGREPGAVARVFKTHDDFSPSLILDFGRDVTGYPEIRVKASSGGVIDVLYGEDLFLVRVDRFVLKGGPQVLAPYGRRTFRYMKLLFPETPKPVEIAEVSVRMDTYPVERAGAFTCSDGLLNRIWETGRYTMRMSMLDHFVDCPWRERTLYGGDLYAENLISHYAFGDPRMNRKCLRQAFAIQYPEGALPPYGPYRGCDGFYPSWSAFFGLGFTDHFRLTGDVDFLNELWPCLVRLIEWATDRMEESGRGLMGSPEGRHRFHEWMQAERDLYEPWQNFPFYRLLRETAELARMTGRRAEAEHYAGAAERMAAALEKHLVDPESGLVRAVGGTAGRRHQSRQYDNALMLWSGIPSVGRGLGIARSMFEPGTGRIGAPFHGLFVTEGLFAYGEDLRAVDFVRRYWGSMLDRGATTFWDNFSLDWPPGVLPDRQTSLCHGWAAGPTYSLPAHVLGVRPHAATGDGAGFRRVLVEPRPADIEWASGKVPTPRGPVKVSWQRERAVFRVELDVPRGSTARVSLPPGPPAEAGARRVEVDGRRVEIEREGDRPVVEVDAGRHVVVQAP